MPSVESANITYNAIKVMNEATVVGPILLGMAKPVHIVTSAASPRTLVNLAAISSVSE
jgi:malate dehydrogenase (oxaloacetate-decarboxylating)(NADP+)